ncbi:hypothetical protein [Rhizomonospora bruguierae]|uniref:hypothetical protein n=1 Tax=Rhizomonospora bruguierae TaxID=1581705 RepID=UPI001BCC1E8D|nr:hypothetical protein [Micromonospora sp. NBRC 107566]
MTMGRLRAAPLVVLLGALLVPVAGCGGGCTKARLTVEPVRVSDVHAPLTLRARLTRDGRPFPGAKVKMAVSLLGAEDARGEARFTAVTDADGVATVTRPEGVAGLSVPGRQVTGYGAYFQPWRDIDGRTYCWSSVGARITCGDGSCPRDSFPAPSPTG